MSKTAIVIGVGAERGLGGTLCRRFARAGLHVFVAGRTPEKIERIAERIRGEGGDATAVATDATSEASVIELFRKAEATGPVDLAIYNAGNNMPGDLLGMEAEFFERCWRVGCFGGFLFGREAARSMLPHEGGTLIFTGASASIRGKAFFSAFTAAKGGLRNFAQSMAREFGPKGLHVGHVVVDGGIAGDQVEKGWPEFAASKGDGGLVDLEGIAAIYEMLYRQPKAAWSLEIDVRTSLESF
jgi:NAD(P)-dependent dehydrogenase (short-subunit alcohol dehydrogenase family)